MKYILLSLSRWQQLLYRKQSTNFAIRRPGFEAWFYLVVSITLRCLTFLSHRFLIYISRMITCLTLVVRLKTNRDMIEVYTLQNRKQNTFSKWLHFLRQVLCRTQQNPCGWMGGYITATIFSQIRKTKSYKNHLNSPSVTPNINIPIENDYKYRHRI